MAANLSPEYKKAEQAFRMAQEARERLECLKEMLRTIPKHKGTEHIQADIKSRMRQLTDELNTPHKGPARTDAAHSVRREGAGQVCLVGPPNSGKSSLHGILTGSKAAVGPFPYTTREPLPGMLPFEDVAFQLVDGHRLADGDIVELHAKYGRRPHTSCRAAVRTLMSSFLLSKRSPRRLAAGDARRNRCGDP